MSITQSAVPEHPLLAALGEVRAGLAGALSAQAWSLSGEADMVAVLQGLECAARQISAVSLRVIAEADRQGTARAANARSTASWLAGLLAIAPGEAAGRVRLAHALDASGMCAATGQALAAGALSAQQARVIERTVRALPADATVPAGAVDGGGEDAVPAGGEGARPARAAAEAFLVDKARVFAPTPLGKIGKHLRAVIDPEGEEKLARDESAQRAARELHTVLGSDGMWHLRGQFDGPTGALLASLLEPLAKPRPAGPEGPDARSKARRQADGFAEILDIAARAGQAPEAGGQRPHIAVTIPFETLKGELGAGAAEVEHGFPICAQTARMLACDGGIVPILLGSAGEPLDVGRQSQSIPAALRRALVARDGGCAWPGCDVPPARCDAHHIEHWGKGGKTALCNLCLFCSFHHFAIHHDGWAVIIDTDGHPTFTPPRWIDPAQRPVRSTRASVKDFHSRQ
jgi:hypothetical protein